ncbi:MAG: hypothetical protein P8I82_07125 [Flavobacteriales bacterium]|nr:hypothetical protein [Flavobacteriales bacterium]
MNIFKVLALSLLFSNCGEKEITPNPFKMLPDGKTIQMKGEIGSSSLDDFNLIIREHPSVNLVRIVDCDGSVDDETCFLLMKRVHDLGINTHIVDRGWVASGGVDFFLAGIHRTRGANTKIGVHSWSQGNNEATDYPRGHEYHQPYIAAYVSIGLSQEKAEQLYHFIINAAPADEVHWMTDAEIEAYSILSE